jgi:hypothetical protein
MASTGGEEDYINGLVAKDCLAKKGAVVKWGECLFLENALLLKNEWFFWVVFLDED